MGNLKFGIELKDRPKDKLRTNLLSLWIAMSSIFDAFFVFFCRNKKMNPTLLIILFCGCASFGWTQSTADSTETKQISGDNFGINTIEKRFIDNKGRGDERFDGTRNFRAVLYDLVYRGGGNNLHLKDTIPKYYLWNPMPIYGLRQLQSIGFDKAVYLYSYNFEYWYPQRRLDSLANEGFDYICEPKLDRYLKSYLQDVMVRAKDKSMGMIYIHCWNGWHQSGLLSAYTLMQFCDYSNSQALKYWENCTDGNYRGFSKLKARIKNYRPYKEFNFTAEQKKKYCPCENDISKVVTQQSEDDKVNLTEDEMMQKESTLFSSKNHLYHKIKSGESLGSISERYGMKISELKRLNDITGTKIYAGRKLKVIKKNPIQSHPKKHKVKPGDSLYGIARKYKTSIDAIKKANGLNKNTIYPGQTLKIL
jgi:LysM repeat protein